MRETPDFVDAKCRIQETIKDSNIIDVAKIKNNPVWQEKVNKKTAIYYFLIQISIVVVALALTCLCYKCN
ncbi:MFS sugar transporter [Rickettsia peacockii]|uniref:MFS sugar transporter n=1 Tax=Rickettsia peacockii TaxID=47589 RepID=UPI0002FA7344|nr:MFS sugar transporter [Rickettsia peacockii]